MKKFLLANKVVIGIIVVILAGGGVYWYITSSKPPTFSAYTVARGNVVASVDVAGSVLAENSANLSFQEPGTIAQVDVQEGNNVAAGTVLVSLNAASLQAGVEQAQAGLAAAQANLAELQTGTRPQQLQIDENAVTNAQTSLSASLASAYAAADDAVTNQTDNFFSNPNSTSPVFNVPVTNSQLVTNIESERETVGASLTAWFKAINASSTSLTALSTIANTTLAQVQSYLDDVALAVNSAVSSAIAPATLAQYKVDVVTARTETNGALTALVGAESALNTAQSALTLAQAGSTPQQIQAQQAVVLQAQAELASAQTALSNASIVAPFSGTVQNLTAQIGQVVTPGVPLLSLVNSQGLKVVGYVSETDVANIKAAQNASITLDAYGPNTIFPATVTTVDSSETSVNGTPEYGVTLHFINADPRIKDGMTGNIHIITGEHDNVIEVPTNLIITSNNNYYVLVAKGGVTNQQQVTLGLAGNGMTEITSGLNVGDQIINF